MSKIQFSKKSLILMLVFVCGFIAFGQRSLNTDYVDYYQNAIDSDEMYVDEYAAAFVDGKVGFVNKDNEFVVNPIYASAQNAPGKHFFVCKDFDGEKCAYMNKKTKQLLTDFKYIGCGNGDISEGFSDGMAKFVIVGEDGEWKTGYLNEKGEEVIPARYYFGLPFKNGVAKVLMRNEFPLNYIEIDKKGSPVK